MASVLMLRFVVDVYTRGRRRTLNQLRVQLILRSKRPKKVPHRTTAAHFKATTHATFAPASIAVAPAVQLKMVRPSSISSPPIHVSPAICFATRTVK